MHLFQSYNILYLAFNALAGFFLMAGVLGIPGNPSSEEKSKIKDIVMNIWGILVLIAFKGVPILAVASIIALFLRYDFIGALLAALNLALGFSVFITLLIYYFLILKKK